MPFRDVLAPLVSSRTLMQVGSMALAIGLYSCLPAWKEYSALRDLGDIPSQFHVAFSLVLGWLLVFRTNSAYARWWEARTLWGALVNAVRNFAIKSNNFARPSASSRAQLQEQLIRFPRELMLHLRRKSARQENTSEIQEHFEHQHKPSEVVNQLYRWLQQEKSEGRIDGDEFRSLDLDLVKFLEICGGCERIAGTPIVRSYRVFARQCIMLFLLTLPWGIIHEFGWWAVPLTTITAYFMIGMEVVAEHVEEPFGTDEDDLNLEALCKTMEDSVRMILANSAD